MNVSPINASCRPTDCHLVNVQLGRNRNTCSTRSTLLPCVDNFLGCQFRLRKLIAFSLSPFCHLVGIVGSLVPEERMIRIATYRVVAAMQNMHSTWDLANQKLSSYSMGVSHLLVSVNKPISSTGLGHLPYPARPKAWIGFWNWPTLIYILPKEFTKLFWCFLRSAHKQETTPIANSVVGEVIAAICKRGDKMFSLLYGHNKANLIFSKEGSFSS